MKKQVTNALLSGHFFTLFFLYEWVNVRVSHQVWLMNSKGDESIE